MKPKVDLIANEGHFLDHIGPVGLELARRGLLGDCHVGLEVSDQQIERWEALRPRRMTPNDKPHRRPVLCSAITDVNQAAAKGCRSILMEHGAGQSYSTRHKSYVGGRGRNDCLLVLVPNQMAARRHQLYYDTVPVEVVGSPRVDALLAENPPMSFGEPPTIAVSFHWDCIISDEAGSAWPHFGPEVLQELHRMREAGFINVVGHAHPRIADLVRPACDELDITFLESFEDVCNLADVYMIDNSSTLFEFAALDRPVVVMNSPAYRRRVTHGLRFWDYADIGPQVGHPKVVAQGVTLALTDPPAIAERRRRYIREIYGPLDGKAAVRAADAIEEHALQP